jgi:LuxR family maltose regulon positive regulatory protein
VQYERNDLDWAAVNLNKAAEYYELVGSWYRVRGYALLVDLHQALGEVEGALGYLGRLKRISLTPGLSLPDIPLAALIAARSLLLSRTRPDLGDLFAEAVAWGETSGLEPNDEFRYGQEYEYLTLARVLVAQNKAEAAIPLLDRLIASAEAAGRGGDLIAYLSLQAVAHHTQHKTDRALTYLSSALALGEPEGYVRNFVNLGPPMRDLLQTYARRGVAPRNAYVSRLLAAFPDYEFESVPALPTQPERREIDDLLEPLTERELQILHLLSARRSYREIAEELSLSLNTIKWYAKNIYAKLGVNNRSQAASRARELSLL